MPHGCNSLLFLNSNALKAPGLCEYHNRFQEGEWQNCAAYAEFSISGIYAEFSIMPNPLVAFPNSSVIPEC